METPPVKLTREDLHKEIWNTPIHRLSVKYGLSDVGLAKVCKRMNIPRPPRGYWRRLTTGKNVSKPPLPKPGNKTQLEITFTPRGQVPDKRTVKREVRSPARPPIMETVLTDPHPLVALTRDRLEVANEDRCGLLVLKAKRILDIRVSRPQLDRCLRLMDSLFKSWEAEGFTIRIIRGKDTGPPETFLCSGDERLRIAIEEAVEEYEPGPTDEEKLLPKWEWQKHTSCRVTSMLKLSLDGQHVTSNTRFYRRYQDRVEIPVETKAQQIWQAGTEYFEKRAVYAIEQEKRRVAAEERQRQWQLEREQWKAEYERKIKEEELREEEQQKIKELAEAAGQWTRAQQVRDFIPACEKKMKQAGIANDVIATWGEWARAAANEIDPLVGGYPEIPKPK
jgi:hypothetical protein